jgi:hypothetical protein
MNLYSTYFPSLFSLDIDINVTWHTWRVTTLQVSMLGMTIFLYPDLQFHADSRNDTHLKTLQPHASVWTVGWNLDTPLNSTQKFLQGCMVDYDENQQIITVSRKSKLSVMMKSTTSSYMSLVNLSISVSTSTTWSQQLLAGQETLCIWFYSRQASHLMRF